MDKWTTWTSILTGHTVIQVIDKRGIVMQLLVSADNLRNMTPQEF